MHERRFDPKQVAKLEDPERLKWLSPEEILGALELAPGMQVADIGAGTGYFALPIAEKVAPGRVFAVDVAEEMLEHLRHKCSARGVENVEPVLADAERTALDDASCDLVFYATVWHEIEDHEATLLEAERLLKSGGRIAILDWSPEATRPPGPPIEHRIGAAEVVGELAACGWHDCRAQDIGKYTYMVVARRPME